ncbi:MAG: phage exclusion protein Lit family protein [Zavarzinia sp.]|nr:phage exclusion protein Lit family protein [Zavarzinia sp.]
MTVTDARSDPQVQDAIKQLFYGSAPERCHSLATMWQQIEPLFQLVDDIHPDGRIILDAGAYRYVRFNHRALRAFWIAGHAAWEAYRLVAESPDLQQLDMSRFTALIAAFEQAIGSDDPTVEPLPAGVAEPGVYPDKQADPQGRATAELATIAAAWALLHEFRHIRHQQEGTGSVSGSREDKHREELSCDEFATNFLLERISEYAVTEGVDVELVRQKRQLGIYFGLFAVTLLAKDKWQASDSHPSVQDRLDAVRAIMEPTKNELAAAIAHVAFATLGQQWPGTPNLYNIRRSETTEDIQ